MRCFYLICFCLAISLKVFSQNSLRAYFDLKKFYSDKLGTYVEVFNKINGESITYINKNSELKGKIAVTYSIFQKDSLLIQINDTLNTLPIKDSLLNDLYDVKVIPLKVGVYLLHVNYTDLNNNEKVLTKANFEINDFDSTKVNVSNIQIADYIYKTKEKNVLSKYGYDLLPHLGNYFSSECNILPIYFEIYNTANDTNKYRISYSINDMVDQKIIENKEDTTYFKPGKIHPIIKPIDIRNLQTGHYTLKIIIENNLNKSILKSDYEFYRSNNIENKINSTQIILNPDFQKSLTSDSLIFYAKSLMPIVFSDDQQTILKLIKNKDTSKLRVYFETFWQVSSHGKKPFDVWIDYKRQVLLTEKLYKTLNVHGFETERGRVYLKYGPPTSISTRESSPSEYPYEIWQYDKIKTFSNKRFVFYNPDIVGNNFRLLHSDLNGEVKNFKWPGFLRKRNNSTINVDDPLEGGYEHFGGESTEVYNQY